MSPAAAQQPAQPPSQSTSKTLPPSAMPLIAPKALLHAHLSQHPAVRPCGRTPTQTRPIGLNIGSLTHCNGSSVVKIGHTTIICGVRAEILPVSEIPSYNTRRDYEIDPTSIVREDKELAIDPKSKSKTSSKKKEQQEKNEAASNNKNKSKKRKAYDPIALYNLITPNLDLSTGCSPSHAPNTPPSTSAQSLTQRIYTLLLSTQLVPSTDLEIYYVPPPDNEANHGLDPDDPAYVSGADQPQLKAYWALYIDLMCISHGGEGSVFDAAWFAIVAALRDTLLPRAWWDVDLNTVICDENVDNGSTLNVRSGIVPLSFGVFDMNCTSSSSALTSLGSNKSGDRDEEQSVVMVLLDQDAFEEECCPERGCVSVDSTTGTIVRLEKSGGSLLGVDEIESIVREAGQRGAEWHQVLEQALSVARK